MDGIASPAHAHPAPDRRSPAAGSASPIRRRLCALLAVCLLVAAASAVIARSAQAQTPGPCRQGGLPGGALSLICVPAAGWNGELVLFAHGYLAPGGRLRFAHLGMPGRVWLPDLVQGAGYAFATTSYRRNGLAVLEGIEDLRELSAAFTASAGAPRRVLATGVSEGGLVVTLLAERNPDEIDGALAACGPLGGLRRQVDHIGDVRVLFDYFFPGVLPGHPTRVPPGVRRDWNGVHRPRIRKAVRRQPRAARALARTAGLSVDVRDGRRLADAVVDALWYSVHGSRDLAVRLGGNPYDNAGRRYSGSGEDRRLNRRVRRIRASQAARAGLSAYEPTGRLNIPLTAMHTRGDEIVPFAHQADYARRVARAGAADLLVTRAVRRYGHCAFRSDELLEAFGELAARAHLRPAPSSVRRRHPQGLHPASGGR